MIIPIKNTWKNDMIQQLIAITCSAKARSIRVDVLLPFDTIGHSIQPIITSST